MKRNVLLLIGLLISARGATAAIPLDSAFTYQGRLNDGTNAANGIYDLDFALFEVPTGGSQLGLSVTSNGRLVSNGLFTVTLDFGADRFSGDARWMQIQVRTNGGKTIPWTPLSPRQALTPSPYALYAPNAGTALGTAAGAVGTLSLAPGAVTSEKIADGTLTAADLSPTLASNTFWRLGGNAGTVPGLQFLGTTDSQAVEIQVNGQRALRLEPGVNGEPNVVGGYSGNYVQPGLPGVTIGGGGASLGNQPSIVTNYGYYATIAGGYHNAVASYGGAVLGGSVNYVGGDFGVIGGGQFHNNLGDHSVIGGGTGNSIQNNSAFSFIGGGNGHVIEPYAYGSFIGGGTGSVIENSADHSFIGGGWLNRIQAFGWDSVISGGESNLIGSGAQGAAIGGGVFNTNFSSHSSMGGGYRNSIQNNSPLSFIGGGNDNVIQLNAYGSFIGGGNASVIETNADHSFIGGGWLNRIQAFGWDSVVSGGTLNLIGPGAQWAVIGGGQIKTNFSPYATIGGGSGNIIETGGYLATVPGGGGNLAGGFCSFAAGHHAQAIQDGAFVWADATEADYASTGDNQFCIRASGGVQLSPGTSLYCGSQVRQMLNLWSTNYGIGVQASTLYFRTSGDQPANGFAWYRGGGHSDAQNNSGGGATLMTLNNTGLTVKGTFVSASDRNLKENFAAVSPRDVLDKVTALPISRWNFKGDAATPHVGPMAQDFHAAFALGTDDKHIATVDADGVALAAIQGLNQKLEQRLRAQDAEIQNLRRAIADLKQLVNQSTR